MVRGGNLNHVINLEGTLLQLVVCWRYCKLKNIAIKVSVIVLIFEVLTDDAAPCRWKY